MRKKESSIQSDNLSLDKIRSRFFRIIEWYNYAPIFGPNEDTYIEGYGFELGKVKKKLKSTKDISKLNKHEYEIAVEYLLFDTWYFGDKKSKKLLDYNISSLNDVDKKFYNELWAFSPIGLNWARKKKKSCLSIIGNVISVLILIFFVLILIFGIIAACGDFFHWLLG